MSPENDPNAEFHQQTIGVWPTGEEAQKILEVRKTGGKKRFDAGSRARVSTYLLSGGLFRCDRCQGNMIGFHTGSGYYYVCGSQPYRKGMGCGPVYTCHRDS